MRSDAQITWVADMHTGTSRLAHSLFLGVIARYAISYGLYGVYSKAPSSIWKPCLVTTEETK